MIATRSRLTVVVTTAVLLLAAALFTNFLPFRQILGQQRALNLAETQLDMLENENALLEDEVAALMTDAEVERIARESFGYVMPGEEAIVIVSPSGEPDPKSDEPLLVDQDRSWWQEVWDFLSGRDLQP